MGEFSRFGSLAPGGPPNSWQQGVGYVDGVSPLGNIDGANTTYTLVNAHGVATAPNPAKSLMLFADGLLCYQEGLSHDTAGNPLFTYLMDPTDGTKVIFNNPLPASVVFLRAWFRFKIGG